MKHFVLVFAALSALSLFGAVSEGGQPRYVLTPSGTGAGNTGELRFKELVANGNHHTGFKAPDSLAASVIYTLPPADGTNTYVLSTNGSGILSWVANGLGSVSSVALSMPAEFSVAGSPITTSGTFTVSKANQSANTVFAGPTAGGAAAPAFRALVEADIGANTVNTAAIKDANVTLAKIENIATDRLLGRDTASSGVPEQLTVGGGVEFTGSGGIQRSALTGDVTATAGSNATTIANNAVTTAKISDSNVTLAKLANSGARTVVGRSANSSGVVADISLAVDGKFLGSRASAIGAFYPTQTLTKTASYSATQDDYGSLILMNVSTTGQGVTLPAPATVGSGWWIKVKKINSSLNNTVAILRNASETIDGRSVDEYLREQYSYAAYQTDGTNWFVLEASDYVEIASGVSSGWPAATTTGTELSGAMPVSPGVWDFSFNLLNISSSVVTDGYAYVGTATGSGTAGLTISNTVYLNLPTSTRNSCSTLASSREVITAASQNRYLKGNLTYSGATGGPNYQYRISAVRVR